MAVKYSVMLICSMVVSPRISRNSSITNGVYKISSVNLFLFAYTLFLYNLLTNIMAVDQIFKFSVNLNDVAKA